MDQQLFLPVDNDDQEEEDAISANAIPTKNSASRSTAYSSSAMRDEGVEVPMAAATLVKNNDAGGDSEKTDADNADSSLEPTSHKSTTGLVAAVLRLRELVSEWRANYHPGERKPTRRSCGASKHWQSRRAHRKL
jgi:hypothetical protein